MLGAGPGHISWPCIPPCTHSPWIYFVRWLLIPSTCPLPSRHIDDHDLLAHLTAQPLPQVDSEWGPLPECLCSTEEKACSLLNPAAMKLRWKKTCTGFFVAFLAWEGCSPPLTASSLKTTFFPLLFDHLVQGKLVTLHSFEAAAFIYTACSSLARWSIPALVYNTTPPTDCRVSFLPSVLLGWIPLHSSSPEQWFAQHMDSLLLPGHCHTHRAAAKLSPLLIFYATQPRCGGQFIGNQNKDLKEKKSPRPTLRCKQCFQSFCVTSI